MQILYINGAYRGDDLLGRLMHDFNCSDADDMHFPIMAEKVRYLKENEKGVAEMCRVIEEMRKQEFREGKAEGKAEGKVEGQLSLLYLQLCNGILNTKQAAECIGVSVSELMDQFQSKGYGPVMMEPGETYSSDV